jgi:galactose mutarotase-like enzyme
MSSACSIEILTLQPGIPAVRMSNEFISVDILPEKGADIYSLVHRPTQIDVLLKLPAGLRAINQGLFSSDSQTAWLEMYEGGWQEILPNGGDPCHYKNIELNFHGESTTLPWHYEVVKNAPDEVIVDFSVQLFRSPLHITRRMSLAAGSDTLKLDERVTNLAGEPIELMWGHHPAFGSPFLSGDCRIHTNAQTILVDGASNTDLVPLSQSAWPHAQTVDGATRDLSRVPPQTERSATMCYLKDFEGAPWYAIVNPTLKLGVGLTCSPEVFKCFWLWQEMGSSAGFPFYKRTYTMAIEPWTSYPGHGLVNVISTTQTHLTLSPGQVISAQLNIRLFGYDEGQPIPNMTLCMTL